MISFEKTEIIGLEHATRGMRNPMNSWDKRDSGYVLTDSYKGIYEYKIGSNDLDLMKRLSKAGTDHRKFMRMIVVYVDITAPLYWWKEFDTYKVGTVANSCSTMHKIHEKEFKSQDFSIEKLNSKNTIIIDILINALNNSREQYLTTNDRTDWEQLIQLLPTSYNQKRTIMLNYEVLSNIYRSRKNHKLDEWIDMCRWIENLDYSELITQEEDGANE